MSNRSRRARKLIWLTPESLQAAERLSSLTGMPVPDLIELVLLELTEHEMAEAPPARSRPPATRPAPPPPGRVIPIDRARAARRASTEAWAPRAKAEDLADLHTRCSELRVLAKRTRDASMRARARTQAVLDGRGED
jgi:hypothetical protein